MKHLGRIHTLVNYSETNIAAARVNRVIKVVMVVVVVVVTAELDEEEYSCPADKSDL